MTELARLCEGYQKVADRYHRTVFVFLRNGKFEAFTNKDAGRGELVKELEPTTEPEKVSTDHGRFEIAAATRV